MRNSKEFSTKSMNFLFHDIQQQKKNVQETFKISENFIKTFIVFRFTPSGNQYIDSKKLRTLYFLYGSFKKKLKLIAIHIMALKMTSIHKIIVLTLLLIKYLKYIGETLALIECREKHIKNHPNFILLPGNITNCNLIHTLVLEYTMTIVMIYEIMNMAMDIVGI